MMQLIYDSCLLHIDLKDDISSNRLSDVVDMQTDDTLILIDTKFANAKQNVIVDVKIMTKSRDELDSKTSLKFNDTIITRLENVIHFNQITQSDHFQLIKNASFDIINSRSKIRIMLTFKN